MLLSLLVVFFAGDVEVTDRRALDFPKWFPRCCPILLESPPLAMLMLFCNYVVLFAPAAAAR